MFAKDLSCLFNMIIVITMLGKTPLCPKQNQETLLFLPFSSGRYVVWSVSTKIDKQLYEIGQYRNVGEIKQLMWDAR